MKLHNYQIAGKLNQLSDLLEINGANSFRVRAYRKAARSIQDMNDEISDLMDQGENLSNLPEIGSSISDKIEELVKTGKLEQLEKMKKKVPVKTNELLKIQGLGPRKIEMLYSKLKIKDLKNLEREAKKGNLEKLEGFGKKTQEKILHEIEKIKEEGNSHVFRWDLAEKLLRPYLEYLKENKNVQKIEVAGSFRRRKENVGDLDILCICKSPEKVMTHFVSYEEVSEVLSKGETKSSVILNSAIQVDLRVVEEKSYGSAMVYFTGSKAHNVKIRKLAGNQNFKINEYGVFKGDKQLAGAKESDVYKSIGLAYIEPELRENTGEIEAAREGNLPQLIKQSDIKGDLQMHSTYSDGKHQIQEMADYAEKMGYNYIAITDHSLRVRMAGGMDEKKLRKQIEEIDQLNQRNHKIKVLKSCEVDILESGQLDLPDSVLQDLDIVVCSIHYKRNLSKKKQTERILKAMENPYFHILAHPTGRLLNQRDPYEVDLNRIFKKAEETGCFVELNASPERIDLPAKYARKANDMGVKIVISTDSHSINQLENMRLGIGQARRAWLEPKDVINTRSWKDIEGMLR